MDMYGLGLIFCMLSWIAFIIFMIIGVRSINHLRNEVYYLKEAYIKLKCDVRKLERAMKE